MTSGLEDRVKKVVKYLVGLLGAYFTIRLVKFLQWRARMNKRYIGPAASVFMGNLGDLTANGGFSEEFFRFLHHGRGDFVRFWIGPNLNLSITNPETILELYKKGPSRPRETELFLNYLGKDNLLFQHGPMVKQLRLRYGKMISTTDALQKVHDAATARFLKEIRSWTEHPVDLWSKLGPMVYDIMGEVIFGEAWSATHDGQEIKRLHCYLIANSVRWAFYPVKPWWNSEFRAYVQTIQDLRDLCNKLLDEHAKNIERTPQKYENDCTALTMLLTERDEDGHPFFSRSLAISTLIGFLNGAYDTTHSSLYWLFFNLARNQDVQAKLATEIHDNVGRKLAPSLQDLRELSYLDAVIQESLRYRCTVPMNQRVNLDESISLQGVTVPKGVCVSVPMFITMRSEQYFPDPDHFIPERFLGETPNARLARKYFMAFGGHARMCVGFTFALAEMKAIICAVLQKYRISLMDPEDQGEFFVEAGVNQPKQHSLFLFQKHEDPQII